MSTDWSARTAAIEYFEKLVKQLKRVNDDDKELYEAALHALRRSQDHTAIQTKLAETVRECERLQQLLATTLDGEEGIHVSTGGKGRDEKLFSALDVQAFTAIGFALRKKPEADRAANPSENEITLRRLLAFTYSSGHLYGDDGELQDNRLPHPIDYVRDSVTEIERKINARGMDRLQTEASLLRRCYNDLPNPEYIDDPERAQRVNQLLQDLAKAIEWLPAHEPRS
jgi:hypothetical protein